jgi:hypothetical protein
MARKNTELYLEPVSQGNCEVLGCSNPAKYRGTWAQGMVIKLMCTTHKADVEGKLFQELSITFQVQKTRTAAHPQR